MELLIYDIKEDGSTFDINSRDTDWFRKALAAGITSDVREISGRFNATLLRTEDNVSIIGELFFEFKTDCDRCLEEYICKMDIPLNIILLPSGGDGDKKEEGADGDKLEVMFYSGDRIDLFDVIRELIVLNLPMKRVCSENCKGLCPSCGKNLNQGECTCERS